MLKSIHTKLLFILILILLGCQTSNPDEDLQNKSWSEIREIAKGKEVTLMMWQGDPLINQYLNDFVIPEVKQHFNIDLHVVAGQGSEIVSTLMTEIEAGKPISEIDMTWINGETFYQLRQIKALYGPFVHKLPNNQYINWENHFIAYDFQQPVEGYECPWGNVQMALIYNQDQVKDLPQTLQDLEIWVNQHPGKFTFSNDFTGMTLLKSWLIHLAGGRKSLAGPFDEEKYSKYSQKLWDYVNRIKPYLWNEGQSFPASVATMHQLFANGELWFTMSNNDSEVDNKIMQGIFPENSQAYVPQMGTIQNSHYLGIVDHSSHKAVAMVVINYLISPEAQWKKMQPKIWGDGTILSLKKLPKEWQQKFSSVPGREYAPQRSEIQDKALMEPAPEYMIRIFEDFRKEVIEN